VVIDGQLRVSRWVAKNGTINCAYEIHLVAPIKPIEPWKEQLSPLTPDLYQEPE
jgi:hypothetical protein